MLRRNHFCRSLFEIRYYSSINEPIFESSGDSSILILAKWVCQLHSTFSFTLYSCRILLKLPTTLIFPSRLRRYKVSSRGKYFRRSDAWEGEELKRAAFVSLASETNYRNEIGENLEKIKHSLFRPKNVPASNLQLTRVHLPLTEHTYRDGFFPESGFKNSFEKSQV